MYGGKRRRTAAGYVAGGSLAARKAIAINRKMNARFPYAQYGRAYYRRGHPDNLAAWGPSFAAATPAQKQARREFGYYGRGKYSLGKLWRATVGKQAGRRIRDAVVDQAIAGIGAAGQAASMYAGSGLYSGRGAYSGRGEYRVGEMNNLIEGGRPSIQVSSPNDETQSVTISNCEYMQDVYGAASAAFSVEAWNLNPGLLENFPWLAQIAANYEEYEFIQLLFHYKSTVDASAINNTNGSTGTIILATNYNPSAANFTNKETMMQYHGAISGRVVDEHTHGVECDPDKIAGTAQKYVRVSPVVVNQDIKTFDLGKFQLGQSNIPSAFQNQQIGELWVTYTVKLTKPRLFTALGSSLLETRFTSLSGSWGNIIYPTTTVPFGLGIFGSGSGSAAGAGTWSVPVNLGTMQQGAIPVILEQNSMYGQNYAAGPPVVPAQSSICNVRLTFPDFLTGVFELLWLIEGSNLPLVAYNPTYSGSCAGYSDLLSTNNAIGGGAVASVNPSSSNQLVVVHRVSVQPIVAGADNRVTCQFVFTVDSVLPAGFTINSTSLLIRQMNPTLGQTPSQVVPAFVNAATGAIATVPLV